MSNINRIIKKELKEFKNDIGSTLLIILMTIVLIAGMMVFFAYDYSKSNTENTYSVYIENAYEEFTKLISTTSNFEKIAEKEDADLIIETNHNDLDIKYDSNQFSSINAAKDLSAIIEAYNNEVLKAELANNNLNQPEAYISTKLTDIKSVNEPTMSIGDAIIKILLPMAILFFVPLIIMTPASSIIATEKDSKTLESTLLLPVSRKEIVIGKFFTVVIIGLVSLLLVIATFVLTSMAIKTFFDVDVSLKALDYLEVFILGLSFLLPVGAVGIILSLLAKNVKSAQIQGTVAFFIFAGLTQLPNLIKDQANLKFAPLVNNGLVLNQISNFDQYLDPMTLGIAIAFNIVLTIIFISIANKMIQNEKYVLPR